MANEKKREHIPKSRGQILDVSMEAPKKMTSPKTQFFVYHMSMTNFNTCHAHTWSHT